MSKPEAPQPSGEPEQPAPAVPTPNPGTKDAFAKGCLCRHEDCNLPPVKTFTKTGQPVELEEYRVSPECPIHGWRTAKVSPWRTGTPDNARQVLTRYRYEGKWIYLLASFTSKYDEPELDMKSWWADCEERIDVDEWMDIPTGEAAPAVSAAELERDIIEENLAYYARRYFDMFDLYMHSWLRNIGGVIRPKHHQIDGFALRTQDIYEKAKLVDRIKKIMVDEVKREGATKDTLFDAVFEYLAEDGHDKVPTN